MSSDALKLTWKNPLIDSPTLQYKQDPYISFLDSTSVYQLNHEPWRIYSLADLVTNDTNVQGRAIAIYSNDDCTIYQIQSFKEDDYISTGDCVVPYNLEEIELFRGTPKDLLRRVRVLFVRKGSPAIVRLLSTQTAFDYINKSERPVYSFNYSKSASSNFDLNNAPFGSSSNIFTADDIFWGYFAVVGYGCINEVTKTSRLSTEYGNLGDVFEEYIMDLAPSVLPEVDYWAQPPYKLKTPNSNRVIASIDLRYILPTYQNDLVVPEAITTTVVFEEHYERTAHVNIKNDAVVEEFEYHASSTKPNQASLLGQRYFNRLVATSFSKLALESTGRQFFSNRFSWAAIRTTPFQHVRNCLRNSTLGTIFGGYTDNIPDARTRFVDVNIVNPDQPVAYYTYDIPYKLSTLSLIGWEYGFSTEEPPGYRIKTTVEVYDFSGTLSLINVVDDNGFDLQYKDSEGKGMLGTKPDIIYNSALMRTKIDIEFIWTNVGITNVAKTITLKLQLANRMGSIVVATPIEIIGPSGNVIV